MTFAFKTFGCRLNQAETERRMRAVSEAGETVVPWEEPADVRVVHTCAVTHAAEAEGLRFVRRLHLDFPAARLVVTGCAVKAARERFLACGASAVASPEDFLAGRLADFCALAGVEPPSVRTVSASAPTAGRTRALLKVQDGCDNFCTYCFVPHARGVPRSRALNDCLDEARQMIDSGFGEIVVVGCNLALYADGARRLPELLAALAALPGLGRVRLSSLEPGSCERAVAQLMAENPRVCPFLHLPIQSGDDEVLRRMGRRYDSAQLRAMLAEVCAAVPGLGLGADLIVGFPGETAEQFGRTRQLVADFPFANLHIFPYSPRPGTPAATWKGQVPERVRKARATELLALRDAKRAAFAAAHRGREVRVLVERVDAAGVGHGWSADYLACEVPGCTAADVGRFRRVVL